MNRDIYTGLFFGGILSFFLMAILTLFKLQSLTILFYYIILAFIMSIHNLIEEYLNKNYIKDFKNINERRKTVHRIIKR